MESKMSNSHSSRHAAVNVKPDGTYYKTRLKKTAMHWNTDFYRKKAVCYVFYCGYMFRLIIKS